MNVIGRGSKVGLFAMLIMLASQTCFLADSDQDVTLVHESELRHEPADIGARTQIARHIRP